jgi:hypothetical protein
MDFEPKADIQVYERRFVTLTPILRLKKWPWPFNGSGGSGYWAGGSNFLVEIP